MQMSRAPFDPKLTIAGQPMIYIFNDTADKAARDAETRLRTAQNEAEKQELTKLRSCDERQSRLLQEQALQVPGPPYLLQPQ